VFKLLEEWQQLADFLKFLSTKKWC
jgi:hypothetical protein